MASDKAGYLFGREEIDIMANMRFCSCEMSSLFLLINLACKPVPPMPPLQLIIAARRKHTVHE
jgi:hypothetical protein